MKPKKITYLLPIAVIATINLLGSAVLAAEITLETKTAEFESITDPAGTNVKVPEIPPPLFARDFTIPWEIKIKKDTSITTNTPITDKYDSGPLAAWIEKISTCSKSEPTLYRIAGDKTEIPVTINNDPGKVVLNANNKPVCNL